MVQTVYSWETRWSRENVAGAVRGKAESSEEEIASRGWAVSLQCFVGPVNVWEFYPKKPFKGSH